MAILNAQFDKLLENIEPTDKAKDFAQQAHGPIREHLCSEDDISDIVEDSFLYGSYKRHTAICDIKDVDIILLTRFDPKIHTPDVALSILKDAISRFYDLPDNEEVQSRSIKVNQPLPDEDVEMTLDIIPAIATDDDGGPLLVPDRDLQKWKLSHPRGHLENATYLNSENVSGGMYIPLVKIVKWWWKYQSKRRWPQNEKVRPKGFWLECLVSENFDPSLGSFAEHFFFFLKSVRTKYAIDSGVPSLNDPGLSNEKVATGMDQEEFNNFLRVVDESLLTSEKAINEVNEFLSISLWTSVFGEKFNDNESESVISLNSDGYPSEDEEFIENLVDGVKSLGYTFKIDGVVTKDGFRPFSLLGSRFRIGKTRQIKYQIIETNIDVPHTLKWKVKNRGEEAKRKNQLRGEITNDPGHRYKIEHSRYTGDHYVECYAVDGNNICIARDKIDVPIE